jgi:diguanylate cyclase (GGDEF)-like protein
MSISTLRAGTMLLHLQNTILRMIAQGEPLAETGRVLCREVERAVPNVACSILAVEDGTWLRHIAGPSLDPAYSAAIDGLAIGPKAGSCGTAAFRSEPVAVINIATDPLWEDYRHLILPHGFVACWSSPIHDRHGGVVGTFAFYYRENRSQTAFELSIVETCVHLCSIAIENEQVRTENHRLAYFDTLTGLRNRSSFTADLDRRIEAAARKPFGLLLIDLDRLKLVNDTSGHASGDALIQEAGARIGRHSAPGRAYRIGGDEFAVLLDFSSAEELAATAHTLLQAARVPLALDGHAVVPSLTIGGAVFGQPARDAESLRQNADYALYHAKETNRGGFVPFAPRMGTSIGQRFEAIQNLDSALEENRVQPFYQPIVRLDTNRIVGLEALCRVRDRDGGVIAAEHFQQAMTDPDVGPRLTACMLSAVARDIRAWLDAGIDFEHVGVNVSGCDFQKGDLEQRMTDAFGEHGVPMKHLILEVTESVYLGGDRQVARAVERLRARGLLVALDDFGTGYASLTHLLSFPVDIIKIDRSFVSRLDPGDAGAVIVEALVGIAGKLGMRVVAEGIEGPQQVERLIGFGCGLGQGYHFAKPGDFAETTALLRLAAGSFATVG